MDAEEWLDDVRRGCEICIICHHPAPHETGVKHGEATDSGICAVSDCDCTEVARLAAEQEGARSTLESVR